MVLELLIKPHAAERVPLAVGFAAFVYTFVAIAFSLQLFPQQASILSIAFITIIFMPLFQRLFSIEEKKDRFAATRKSRNLFTRHKPLIYIFAAFFIGVVLATSAVFVFFPSASSAFDIQQETLQRLGAATGSAATDGGFSRFFFNNTEVMVLVFILSILFGAGAIFILAWNASVIGVYAGVIVKTLANAGLPLETAYIYGIPYSLGTIALHGIPEILAYFFAALAGGVLGIGIIREKWSSKEFHLIFKDAVAFFIIAEFLIALAAFLEAFF